MVVRLVPQIRLRLGDKVTVNFGAVLNGSSLEMEADSFNLKAEVTAVPPAQAVVELSSQ